MDIRASVDEFCEKKMISMVNKKRSKTWLDHLANKEAVVEIKKNGKDSR